MRVPVVFAATVALAAMTACTPADAPAPAASAPAPGASLGGGEWAVFEIAGQPVVAGSKPTITFEDGRVFGAGSCNRFMGGYTMAADGLKLEMSQMASTMMACPDALMTQEGQFLGTLGTVTAYGVADGVLTLTGADGKTIRARK
jgi:heat shock protein HslJ